MSKLWHLYACRILPAPLDRGLERRTGPLDLGGNVDCGSFYKVVNLAPGQKDSDSEAYSVVVVEFRTDRQRIPV